MSFQLRAVEGPLEQVAPFDDVDSPHVLVVGVDHVEVPVVHFVFFDDGDKLARHGFWHLCGFLSRQSPTPSEGLGRAAARTRARRICRGSSLVPGCGTDRISRRAGTRE